MAQNVDQLLAALRGEPPPQAAAPEALPAPAAPVGGIPSEEANALRGKIDELERRLGEMAAPPPALEEPAAPLPPSPPTELVLFLQTRLELLEKKLELAQHEALRSNLVLREREEAQRKASREVEELFHSIREQQRSVTFDRALREQYTSASARIQELETRLALSELRMVPAEEVLRGFASEEARAALERRVRELAQREKERELAQCEKPAPPPPGLASVPGEAEGRAAPPAGAEPAGADARSWALALGRIADLEGRLELAEKRREQEREARLGWETDILQSLKSARSQWQKAGGPELLVEAALESMVDSLKARDALRGEMERLMAAIRDEPPDSPGLAPLRAQLAEADRRMEEAQARLDQQMAVVTAWIARNRQGG